jgi:hypothetical protein
LIAQPKSKDENKTTQKIAKVYNTNREAVRKQQKVKQYAPELHEKVKTGEVKQQDAYKVAQKVEKEEKLIQKEIEQETVATQQLENLLFTDVATTEPVKLENETFTDEKGRISKD